ncbi:hypothetical protein LFL97_21735 [Burkholderia sp. JSH-S8]|nr:hypothetical protein LFL97_21735 [Burkholderia sp. JSH-S8]
MPATLASVAGFFLICWRMNAVSARADSIIFVGDSMPAVRVDSRRGVKNIDAFDVAHVHAERDRPLQALRYRA